MYRRLLRYLRCPTCGGTLELHPLAPATPEADAEVSEGLLACGADHWFPVVGGIPRMLPDALEEHREAIEALVDPSMPGVPPRAVAAGRTGEEVPGQDYDRQTRENFTLEWQHHELGGRTWGMDLDDRVRLYFLEAVRIPVDELAGKVMLDAGCGNGSQSVAYTEFGLEVIAIDLSSGLEHGQAFRRMRPGARADRVHFVQADLQHPPLAASSVDLIHSAGVLHHTPDTSSTFRRLCVLLRPGGTFYVWVYKYEPVVTPVVNTIRKLSTRLPHGALARAARSLSGVFMLFCAALNDLGIREYPRMTKREAALALMDIFGAPYAHYHSFPEVAGWYRNEGFEEIWPCNEKRRGFGVCGRRSGGVHDVPLTSTPTAASPGDGEPHDAGHVPAG